MSAGTKQGGKILGVLSEAAAEDFLVRLANLLDNSASVAALLSKYPQMFDRATKQAQVFAYRRELRRAWKSPDQRSRDWYLFSLRRGHALVGRSHSPAWAIEEALQTPLETLTANLADKDFDPLLSPPPRITPFEAALFYLQTRIGDLAKYCANADCNTPYFIADKRSRIFCSEKCAGSGTRESKRRWWRENRAKERMIQ